MRLRVFCLVSLLTCLLLAVSAFAQDAITGNWIGAWGPSANDRNAVTLALKFDGKAVTGNVTGGENVTSAIPIQKGTFDAKTGAVHMEADTKDRRGQTVRFIIDGKVDKGTKKLIYQDTLRVPEYFYCDPYTDEFEGFALVDGRYAAITPKGPGLLESRQLGLALTRWFWLVNLSSSVRNKSSALRSPATPSRNDAEDVAGNHKPSVHGWRIVCVGNQ